MQDPKMTLRLALKNGWLLEGDLAEGNIKFHTGWYDRNHEGLYQVTVTTPRDENAAAQLGMRTVQVVETYQVDIWVKYKTSSNYGAGKAKEYLWDIKEEVKRIVKANKSSLTDIDVLLPGPGVEIPEASSVPPMLRWSYDVDVRYEI